MRQKQQHTRRVMPRTGRSFLGVEGAVLVEFALAAPILVTLVLGIADFGMMAASNAALEGATRIGAEYARDNSTCKSNIQDTNCISGIKTAMQSAVNATLTFPSSSPPFPESCECDDGSSITCGTTCAVGKTPNRTLVTVTASQTYTPILPWPGIPTSLTASTELRIE